MLDYYDLILGLIPLSVVGIVGALVGLGVGLTLAVPVAASFSMLLIGHAMFVNAPTGQSQQERARPNQQINTAD